MRWTAVCLLAVILLSVAAAGSETVQVALVLDSSASMWQRLDDGVYRFAAARLAIERLAAGIATNDGVQISLRLMGSDTRFTEDEACADTRQAFPPGLAVQRAVAAALDGLEPAGARPLVLATVRAVEDLSGQPGRHRVVLVTSGDDTCSGDRRTAAAALAGGTDIKVVGVGLAEPVEQAFNAAAPTRNARTVSELVAALEWAVFGPHPPDKRYPVAINLVRDGAPVRSSAVVLVDPVTGATSDLKFRDQQFETRVPAGVYNATVTDERSNTVEYGHIVVSGIGSNRFRLELPLEPPVTLEVFPDPVPAGAEMGVQYWGAPAGEHLVEVASPDQPLGLWADRATADGPAGAVALRAPVGEGTSEVRFLERLADSVVRLDGRTTVAVEAPRVSLDLQESVVLGSPLSIAWQGPDDHGDQLVIVPAQPDVSQRVTCVFASRGSPAELPAPLAEGGYVVQYVSGLTGSTLATADFRVIPKPVQLHAPDRVGVGDEIVVDWEGPARPGDYLTLAASGSPSGDYLSIHPSESGSPAVFNAPHQPGIYEVRYIKDTDDSTEGSVTVEIYEVQVRLQVPKTVQVGTRFDVRWKGPNAPGDFIALAPEGSRWQRKLDWAFTSAGSPASLGAPFSRGRYEVRYISGSDSRILETVTITVE